MYTETCESLILNQQAFWNNEKLRKKFGLQMSKYKFFLWTTVITQKDVIFSLWH